MRARWECGACLRSSRSPAWITNRLRPHPGSASGASAWRAARMRGLRPSAKASQRPLQTTLGGQDSRSPRVTVIDRSRPHVERQSANGERGCVGLTNRCVLPRQVCIEQAATSACCVPLRRHRGQSRPLRTGADCGALQAISGCWLARRSQYPRVQHDGSPTAVRSSQPTLRPARNSLD